MKAKYMTTEHATYGAAIEQQRQARAAALLEDRSWLTLAGLYWLQAGQNTFGAQATNAIVLPGADLPDIAGTLDFDGETVLMEAAPGVAVTVNGAPATRQLLAHDLTATPDYLTIGPVTLVVIRRGQRYGIRLWDQRSPARQHFTGLRWYPIDPEYQVVATFVPYEPPKAIRYANVLGDMMESNSPGRVHFEWDDEEYFLDAESRGDHLFFNFRDTTNGDTTYPSGRFLYTAGPQAGKVILDFNQATNPFCAYTDFATCPLPPPQNRLSFRVEAGEMNFPRRPGAEQP